MNLIRRVLIITFFFLLVCDFLFWLFAFASGHNIPKETTEFILITAFILILLIVFSYKYLRHNAKNTIENKYIQISIVISIISIIMTITINSKIANEYLRVNGKTKALFGLKEVFQFSYQYYVCLLGIVAIFFAIKANYSRVTKTMALLLALSSIILVFARFWRFLV